MASAISAPLAVAQSMKCAQFTHSVTITAMRICGADRSALQRLNAIADDADLLCMKYVLTHFKFFCEFTIAEVHTREAACIGAEGNSLLKIGCRPRE